MLLLQGIEPDLHWDQYAAVILECAQTFEVQRLYTIGGYLDYAPHTRVPRISAAMTHADLREELTGYDVDLADYEGPTRGDPRRPQPRQHQQNRAREL